MPVRLRSPIRVAFSIQNDGWLKKGLVVGIYLWNVPGWESNPFDLHWFPVCVLHSDRAATEAVFSGGLTLGCIPPSLVVDPS